MPESCIHLAVAYPATSEPIQIHIVSGCDYLKPTLMARPISATALVALYLGFWGLFAAASVDPDSRLAPVWWSLRPVKRTEPPAIKTTQTRSTVSYRPSSVNLGSSLLRRPRALH